MESPDALTVGKIRVLYIYLDCKGLDLLSAKLVSIHELVVRSHLLITTVIAKALLLGINNINITPPSLSFRDGRSTRPEPVESSRLEVSSSPSSRYRTPSDAVALVWFAR